VIDDNEMSMRDFCFHVGVMLCAVPAGGWVIWQMLWVIKFLGEFMLAWWGTHSQQQQQPLPTLPSYATSAGRDLALTAASPHTLQTACKLHSRASTPRRSPSSSSCSSGHASRAPTT